MFCNQCVRIIFLIGSEAKALQILFMIFIFLNLFIVDFFPSGHWNDLIILWILQTDWKDSYLTIRNSEIYLKL